MINVGAAELVILLVGVVVAAAAIWLISLVGRARGSDAEVWARSERVALDATTEPVVRAYLHTSRNLRQIGAIGGLLIAPAVTAATGVDLQLPGLLWLLLGYLVGCLWAELALTRRPTSDQRAATLLPRRLTDYLPTAMLRIEVAGPAVALGLGAVAAAFLDPADVDVFQARWATAESIEVLDRATVTAAVLAPLVVALCLAAQRRIVRRPQPLADPLHRAVDDAMRSSSVRLVGATAIAITGTLISVQVSYLTAFVAPAASSWVGLVALVLLLVSLLQWRWWPHRGWVVLRATNGSRADEPTPVAVAGGDRA